MNIFFYIFFLALYFISPIYQFGYGVKLDFGTRSDRETVTIAGSRLDGGCACMSMREEYEEEEKEEEEKEEVLR